MWERGSYEKVLGGRGGMRRKGRKVFIFFAIAYFPLPTIFLVNK
jgi:hypothetical protein